MMMIRQASVTVMLCLAMSLAIAKTSANPSVAIHEITFDGCHFKMADPDQGRITGASYFADLNPNARHPFETWIQFSCENPATPEVYLKLASIKLTGRGWVLDTSKEDPNYPSPKTTFYALHGKDWEGAGTTQDETDGDENRRTRAFNFCIPHKQFALCGSIQSVAYLTWPKESTLPQVIQLLQSIEFIDDAQVAPANSSTAPSPNH
jgi:hypothetical protein